MGLRPTTGVGAPHVVIDARMINAGGIGTYLRNLVPRVAGCRPHWRFTLLGDPTSLSTLAGENVGIRTFRAPIYSVREQMDARRVIPRDAGVFWAPHYNIPVAVRGPRLLVTVHDVAHLALPQGSALKHAYARFMFSQVARRACAILFDSEFSRAEAFRFLKPRGRAIVARAGVDEQWFGGAEGRRPMREPYVVYVGNWKRHKNMPALLRAFARLRDAVPHRLVLIGRRDGLNFDEDIDGMMRALGDRVAHVGEVGDAALRGWVSHADALVTASRYEGFGLPPLEAMAAGCPAVVSCAGSLPEVCGDAAMYVDPNDESDIAARLRDVLTNPRLRAQLVERGRDRARQFSWDRCATGAVAALDYAMCGS